MIQANELRIFNLVWDTDYKQQVKIVTIDYYEAQTVWVTDEPLGYKYKTSCSRLMGIPLTPEILEACGFEKINHVHGYYFYYHKKAKISIYDQKTHWMGYTTAHCKSLHQLQNLFYALTGTELTPTL